jgi:MFS family permease
MTHTNGNHTLKSAVAAGLLSGIAVAVTAYITSTFLSIYVKERTVGLLYTIASLILILIFAFMPRILRKFGNLKTSFSVYLIAIASAFALAYTTSPKAVPLLFVFFFVSTVLIPFTLDIFLEHGTSNKLTGRVRGVYLASVNSSWVISQIVVGLILTNSDYWKVFTISGCLLIPALFIILTKFRNFNDPSYAQVNYAKAWEGVMNNRNFYGIYASVFLLQFFFSWMIIYTPIYLHDHIGFSWSQIGWIFSVMLLPFVILEYPLGRLADKKLGEKEMLIAGFIVTALSTSIISFLNSQSILIWMAVLFLTRVGASTIEAMTEIYFFKHISDSDAGYLSLFRAVRPLSFVLGPMSATLFLAFSDIKYMFLALSVFMLVGIFSASLIKDTK